MAYTLTQLQTFFTNANAGTGPSTAQLAGLQGIANQNATGLLSESQALQAAIDLGSDASTSVSVQTYQFFLHYAPSQAGLAALNTAYVGAGVQANLNAENRYLAQSLSLALENPAAKADFKATYGAMSYADAAKAIYNVIVGASAAAAAGINVDNAVAFLTNAANIAYYTAFVKGNYPNLAAEDVSLAVKAALVGEIIYNATVYNNGAGVGSYAAAANNLLHDLADDGNLSANNAAGIDLFASYGPNTVFNLTLGSDTQSAVTFNATTVLVPGTGYLNTLSDTDVLTGIGSNAVLNAQIGASDDISASHTIQPTLKNIKTVNLEWISNEVQAINFADTTGMKVLNVNRVTATNPNISHEDLAAEVTSLNLSNATRGGDISFLYREDVLTGVNDKVDIGVNNVRVNSLSFNEGGDGGADEGYFFETVNFNSTGNNDIDSMSIQRNGREDAANGLADGTTKQVLNIKAAGTPSTGSLEINSLTALGVDTATIQADAKIYIADDPLAPLSVGNDGIRTDDLEKLTITGAANVIIDGLDTTKQDGGVTLTVDASAMTGDLKLGVQTASDGHFSGNYADRADKDLKVTTGSGNDQVFTYSNLAGDISTGLGNDEVKVGNGGSNVVEGVSTIDTGAGNDKVTAGDLLATATDNDVDANSGFDDVTAAKILTGEGNDTVTVGVLRSSSDWDNFDLTDNNNDDHFVWVGASVNLGNGDNTITSGNLEEGASITGGDGKDTVNIELTGVDVLAGDTDADVVALTTTTLVAGRTREVTTAGIVDRLGAIVDLGAGDDTVNIKDTESFGNDGQNVVGRDAELRGGAGADVLNVTSLDYANVTTLTSTVDQDGNTTGVQSDLNVNVTGVEVANFTIANQVDFATFLATGVAENDNNENDGEIDFDVMRFDSALTNINLVSQEKVLLQNAATELYEAGTETYFYVYNMRSEVALSLRAEEATGVTAGALKDDSLLTIDATTGLVTTNGGAADVYMYIDYANARGLNDSGVLNVTATSGAFDLDLDIGQTSTDVLDTDGDGNSATGANAASTTDDDTRRLENFTVNFADANSHSINANGFGDVDFRGVNDRPPVVAGDVSSTAATSFTVNSAAGAGKTIAVDAINADVISFKNADGSAVTAANVIVRVDAQNNYTITTGSGSDVLDMRYDDVRSDDVATVLDRADHLNAGTGRDTLIVNGSDNLGVNNNIEGLVASTVIDDDVFATIRGVEKILVDGDHNFGGESMRITLDEQAAITGVDTIALVGSEQQRISLEIGNNFVVANTADNANGHLTTDQALVINASAHTGQTLLDIESKDDDTDIQLINMDVRVNALGGSVINLVNSGDKAAAVELRVTSGFEGTNHTISSGNAGAFDGQIDINSTAVGSFDKLVIVESAAAISNNGGAEGAVTIAIDNNWTDTAFTVDASSMTDTDANLATGGANITAGLGDTAKLTISGTQNSDTIIGGRAADVIDGNNGNDTIRGDEVVDNNELEVVTFAATYDAGDVITVTHNGNTVTITIGADGTTGADVARAFASYDQLGGFDIYNGVSVGNDGVGNLVVVPVNDQISIVGGPFASASSAYDAASRQLRLTGTSVGTDYIVTAAINNAGDNIAQVQTLTSNVSGGAYDVQIVWNGVTYAFDETGAVGTLPGATLAAFTAAVAAAGGTLNVNLATGLLTITGPTTGVNLPLITQVLYDVAGTDSGVLSVTGGDLGNDQANPLVVTETAARSVLGDADTINGGAGNDVIAGLIGADKLDGGTGSDTLDYTLSIGGVSVNLAVNAASGADAQGDTIVNFENIWGSAYNDTLVGSDVANILTGGVGDDSLSGGAGNDLLIGGVGKDTITGGVGTDFIYLNATTYTNATYDPGVDGVLGAGAGDTVEDTIVFASGDGVDQVYGFEAGTDTIRFSDFADRDLLPATLLQQTAAFGGNAAVSGANTELLVVTGASFAGGANATNVAGALGAAFDVTTLADGKVVFAIQFDSNGDTVADSTVFGYYTDTGADDVVAAGDIQILGVLNGSLATSADFWLPTV